MTYASEVTAKQRETIARQENIINGHMEAISELTMYMQRLEAKFNRQMEDVVLRMVRLEQAVEELAIKQAANTDARKKFEAGYWGRIGE